MQTLVHYTIKIIPARSQAVGHDLDDDGDQLVSRAFSYDGFSACVWRRWGWWWCCVSNPKIEEIDYVDATTLTKGTCSPK